jgi:glycosyltransferase involved in cell wall biosynthesis
MLIRNKFIAHCRAGGSSVALLQPSSQTLKNTKRTDGDRTDEQSALSVRDDDICKDLRREQYFMESPVLSVVVIGRNEGERLERCLKSVAAMHPVGGPIELIYVDSASTDGSVERASAFGAKVIRIAPLRPTAAAGRNVGWKAASAPIVLFLDGDTVLEPSFVADSLHHFNDPQIAVVWGHRREINPRASIFNRVFDLDWIYPVGVSEFCGGDALIRRSVLEEIGGYNERVIAAEDTEMCLRIRALGYGVLHVDRLMTTHDLAMTQWSQYWRRSVRTGHGMAEISARSRHTRFPLWQHESRRNIVQGSGLLMLMVAAPVLSIIGRSVIPMAIAIGIVLALAVRTAYRARWKCSDLTTLLLYGVHSHLQHVPILCGQLKYQLDRWAGKTPELIEYKGQVEKA